MAFYRNTVLIIVFSLGLTGLALGLGPDDSSPPELSAGNPLARLGQAIKGLGQEQDKLLPPDQAFQFSANVKDANTLHVDWQIAPGYYLYRDRFKFALLESPEVALGVIDLPRGQIKQEEDGPKEVFHDSASFDLPLKRNATGPVNIRLKAKYQGCAERGVCYSPIEKTVSLQLPATISTANTVLPTAKAEPKPVPIAEQDRIANSLKNDSIWLVAASFFGFGLLMAFSPCIFPMIPSKAVRSCPAPFWRVVCLPSLSLPLPRCFIPPTWLRSQNHLSQFLLLDPSAKLAALCSTCPVAFLLPPILLTIVALVPRRPVVPTPTSFAAPFLGAKV